MELIQTGKSIPGHIDGIGYTALIYACERYMTDVALKLIETGTSNPSHINENLDDALTIAKNNNLSEVVQLLTQQTSSQEPDVINFNDQGFDTVNQETVKIDDYLKSSNENVCFKVNNQHFLTSKSTLRRQLQDTANIKYGCKQAGNTSQYILDNNIIYKPEYFSLSSIFSLQILVDSFRLRSIIDNKNTHNLFYLKTSNKKLISIISKEFIDGGSVVISGRWFWREC